MKCLSKFPNVVVVVSAAAVVVVVVVVDVVVVVVRAIDGCNIEIPAH